MTLSPPYGTTFHSCWNDVPFMSRCVMVKKTRTVQRREDSLSRERIVEAAIGLLDSAGEDGLTFRALSERLATGAGAIYHHVSNKSDLLIAACDAVVAEAVGACQDCATPQETVRALSLGMFDAMDEHPWVGSALIQAAGQLPMVRLLERLGQQVCALGVPEASQWAAASTLLHYIVGVGGQNAANRMSAQAREIERTEFLDAVATAWSQLDVAQYPFARSAAEQLRAHDDREDFLAGVDLILGGIVGLGGGSANRAERAPGKKR
ncbi:TetR/AcrR family transcriptional regulator [Niveibacterium sp. SC-1]|uniref:TetR/AcrR family transcriptional regulator n=1 Tax=Niveibacterium sp. SC-1 TaxID=3135646 RepID=UPI0031203BD3